MGRASRANGFCAPCPRFALRLFHRAILTVAKGRPRGGALAYGPSFCHYSAYHCHGSSGKHPSGHYLAGGGGGVRRKRWFILRESVLALAILLFFLYFGPLLLRTLDLSQEAILLAGGIILFLIALEDDFLRWGRTGSTPARARSPFFSRSRCPLIAGPSAAATVMLFAAQDPGRMVTWTLAVFAASAVSDGRALRGPGPSSYQRAPGALLPFSGLWAYCSPPSRVEMMLDAVRTLF